ncbi:MAG: efflux RND transporter permease subunit [Hyphomonadaceae bacterium]|nr:efflux RND transporter permease subunit [Hyphomonadaceae bacterium]
MTLSDLSVRRPVLATVFSLLIIVFGAVAFFSLPLRELPDVDRPVVSISVTYRGAAAPVVENQVTRIIEDQLSGIEGIDLINSMSRDGRASINVEFQLSRNLEDATNDVRNAVSRARGQLPVDIDEPVIAKTDADADPIIWYALSSTSRSRLEVTDYAKRYIADQISVVDGVANVFINGTRPALRIWLDTDGLAARGLTVDDVESALRTQNVELPAGYVESQQRDYQVRVERAFQTPEEFARLPVGRDPSGPVVRLGDVARIEMAPEESRILFRMNGRDTIGLGIVRQSRSNALAVGEGVKAKVERIRADLPSDMRLDLAFDSTVFIERAIGRVWLTLLEATSLVVIVIFLFLGSMRAAAIPAAVVPVCLIGAFALLAAFGFSINLLTLMALVLSIGLVVDDSIVVLENVQRRIDTLGEPPLVAAERGTRQVFFAIVATTAVLIAVFAPLLFVGGYVGRLFIELAATVAGVVVISAFCALSLSPMMCSKFLKPSQQGTALHRFVEKAVGAARRSYRASLEAAMEAKALVFILFGVVAGGGVLLFTQISSELTPSEDRGIVVVNMQGPEGAGFEYSRRIMGEIEPTLVGYSKSGEAAGIIAVAPSFWDAGSNRFSSGFARLSLVDWEKRHKSAFDIAGELNAKLGQIPGAVIRVFTPDPFNRGSGDFNLALLGSDPAMLAAVGDRIVARARENPRMLRPRIDYEPNSPRVLVDIDRDRAAALGVSVQAIGRTLEATMGARRVNTISDRGQEYYVFLQSERQARSNISDLANRYVRSERTGELVPLATIISFKTAGDAAERRRLNRQTRVSIQTALAPGYAVGDAIKFLEPIARQEIGDQPITIDYLGQARQFREASGAIGFVFLFSLVIVFLVLAAQFESFIHPITIMVTVPLAIAGGLFGLYMFGGTLNIYSQIGLVILIALAAKNGILIVEFANQLRDEGKSVREAILESADLRMRPILMTSLATIAGSVPLILGHGAGAESRQTIGVVIFFGLLVSTMLTLFVAPVVYDLLAKRTRSPEETGKMIDSYAEGEATPAE